MMAKLGPVAHIDCFGAWRRLTNSMLCHTHHIASGLYLDNVCLKTPTDILVHKKSLSYPIFLKTCLYVKAQKCVISGINIDVAVILYEIFMLTKERKDDIDDNH